MPAFLAAAGEEEVSPKLEIEEAPDAVGGVLCAVGMLGEERLEGSAIEEFGEEGVCFAEEGEDAAGHFAGKPVFEGRGEAHFLAVDNFGWQ